MTWLPQVIRTLLMALYFQLPHQKETGFHPAQETIERSVEKKKNKKKKQQREKKHEWNHRRVRHLPRNRSYTGTVPKDVRFSSQQKLRRMYRNS